MAYLAFYRMFRPTKLDEVVRQEHIVKILNNQLQTGKVGHAYLFCGPRGTGKTTIAKIFARAINCEHPVNGSPCGQCPTCQALQSNNNFDIVEIDAASNNGVDEMRDLREKIQYPPVAGRYKVYIIDEVHMLSTSAFNAVLKTLEEPPRHAVFILATTEPQKIPATILSRCMRFDFKLIPQADLEQLIKKVFDAVGKEYEEEAVTAIARAGAGSARDSLSIADMCASYSQGKLTYADVNQVLGSADFDAIATLMSAMLSADSSSALTQVEQILSTGKGVNVLVRDMLNLLNQISIVKMCKGAKQIINLPQETFATLQSLADQADGHRILRVNEVLAKAESDMRYSLNGRITLETAVIKCSMPESDYNIDALMGRISALEQAVKEGVKVAVQATSAPQTVARTVTHTSIANEQKNTATSTKTEDIPVSTPKKQVQEDSWDVPPLDAYDVPPEEFSPFDESKQTMPVAQAQPVAQSQPVAQAQPVQQDTLWAEPQAPSGNLTEGDKKTVFAKFLRALRTTRKNAVVFTLCMDLDHKFEGDTIIFITQNESVYNALRREDNQTFISNALADFGVMKHEVRFQQKGQDAWEVAVDQIKGNFPDTDITIK